MDKVLEDKFTQMFNLYLEVMDTHLEGWIEDACDGKLESDIFRTVAQSFIDYSRYCLDSLDEVKYDELQL